MGIYNKYVKRLLDVFVSIIAVVLLSPLFLALVILVKRNLGSPVFFKQDRPGLNEKIFKLIKFRSMLDIRDENGKLLPDKERVTKFGNKLRATSLDELPELINVLKGDMSIVGPRPLDVKYLDYYNDYEKRRHEVRPGLTGLAQINGRNSISWEKRFDYDIKYIENMSFINDIIIIVKTFEKVLKKENIGEAGTNAPESFHIYREKQQINNAVKNKDKE